MVDVVGLSPARVPVGGQDDETVFGVGQHRTVVVGRVDGTGEDVHRAHLGGMLRVYRGQIHIHAAVAHMSVGGEHEHTVVDPLRKALAARRIHLIRQAHGHTPILVDGDNLLALGLFLFLGTRRSGGGRRGSGRIAAFFLLGGRFGLALHLLHIPDVGARGGRLRVAVYKQQTLAVFRNGGMGYFAQKIIGTHLVVEREQRAVDPFVARLLHGEDARGLAAHPGEIAHIARGVVGKGTDIAVQARHLALDGGGLAPAPADGVVACREQTRIALTRAGVAQYLSLHGTRGRKVEFALHQSGTVFAERGVDGRVQNHVFGQEAEHLLHVHRLLHLLKTFLAGAQHGRFHALFLEFIDHDFRFRIIAYRKKRLHVGLQERSAALALQPDLVVVLRSGLGMVEPLLALPHQESDGKQVGRVGFLLVGAQIAVERQGVLFLAVGRVSVLNLLLHRPFIRRLLQIFSGLPDSLVLAHLTVHLALGFRKLLFLFLRAEPRPRP